MYMTPDKTIDSAEPGSEKKEGPLLKALIGRDLKEGMGPATAYARQLVRRPVLADWALRRLGAPPGRFGGGRALCATSCGPWSSGGQRLARGPGDAPQPFLKLSQKERVIRRVVSG